MLKRLSRNPFVRRVFMWLSAFGFNGVKFVCGCREFPRFLREYRLLQRQNSQRPNRVRVSLSMPIFEDRYLGAGVSSGHYFHQESAVARRVFFHKPKRHVDIGSRVDGSVAHVAVFREIEIFDIRPVTSGHPHIIFQQMDLMESSEKYHHCCDSLSCLHALEHFGLGRYGDRIDITGFAKGFANMCDLIEPNGRFYFSVPIGPERIEFNAHRVTAIKTILELAAGRFALERFSYVDDDGNLHEDVPLTEAAVACNLHCQDGCGIFEFRKK